ncbi:MAG: hypothetical protein OEZ01_17060 [Candidatus Heimdallarchaeota archaeon]|nr:hypothetical protein [Candidatus Heimdallarchaeota archaeon]
MAMRKNDIEQENAKRSKDETDDFFDDEESDEVIDDIDIKPSSVKDPCARKRLEEYLEEKRLRKELDDDLFDD